MLGPIVRGEKCPRPECTNLIYTHIGLCEKHARALRRQQGRVYSPAKPVRDHLLMLRESLGWNRISLLSGVNQRLLRHIVHTDPKHVMVVNAKKILSVPLPRTDYHLAAGGARVCNIGTQRRLQALVAMGYTYKQLAQEIDYAPSRFDYLIEDSQKGVTVRVARNVKEVFDRLEAAVPPETTAAKRSRLRAQRKGWAPPLAWDADEMDDPDALPDFGPRQSDREEFWAYVDDARNLGRTDEQMAEFLGMKLSTFRGRLRRAKAA